MAKLRMTIAVKVSKDVTLKPGAVVEVRDREDEDAASLVTRGFAAWVGDAEVVAELPLERILAAIATLDPANEAHFTKAGKPELKALGELLGAEVSAKQRDEAWAALQS